MRRPVGKAAVRLLIAVWVSTIAVLGQAGYPAVTGAEPATVLEVGPASGGGVRATATLRLAAPPHVVQAVLADYPKWPELFGTEMRLGRLERRPGGAVTELFIKHPLLPGERRLLCENRELPEGGLLTSLLEGDFKQYARTWRVVQDGNERRTRAELELLVEVDTWAPDWLMAWELRRQLEEHFRILNEKVAERVRQGRETR